MFSTLLIHTCNIEEKDLSLEGYEQVESWQTIGTDIVCRYDANNKGTVTADQVRTVEDEDLFFFDPGVSISEGNRILFDGTYFDVAHINKIYDSTSLHHLEVNAKRVSHA